ncbi:MAG TPA: class I SAM-dependent methyltransferase, partial [Bacilli bacterium]|nr:class I SAM-dependent methyltransferase [Bacilli bacterium]
MISKRLKAISSFISSDDNLIDIGCDHALLDIYLVKNNIIAKCYVSDINPKALDNAILNIKNNHLEDKITPILGNGLDSINDSHIDTIIISGLGSYSIIDILKNKIKLKNIAKIIIQANNNHYALRKFLEKINFYIQDEIVIYDNNKYYITMLLKKGYKKYHYEDLLFGPVLKTKKENKKYFLYLKDSYQKILRLLPRKKLI